MARVPSDLELELLSRDLSYIHPDMMKCDEEISYSSNKYKFMPNMLNPQDRVKLLVQTKNYIKVFYGDRYIGIAPRGDSRFDDNGQYIVDQPYL